MNEKHKKMLYHLTSYFKGEKQQSLYWMALGGVAILLGLLGWLYFEAPAWKGALIPLLVTGPIQLLAGATVFFRTNKQVEKLSLQLKNEPQAFFKEESARMEAVHKAFLKYKMLLGCFFGLGLLFVMMGVYGGWGKFTLGSGMALLWQCGSSYLMDMMAEYRADFYSLKLRNTNGNRN